MDATIGELTHRARALIGDGDQGAARFALAAGLSQAAPARSAEEAWAIAEATALLVGLDVGVEPTSVIDAHLERMTALTDGFDDERSAEARALAELERIEFIHGVGDLDPVLHVEVLQRAVALDERLRGAPYAGVRRAAAEAALTAQMIRRWLEQDETSIAVSLEALAVRLGGESDDRLRAIRLDALATAARLRVESGLDLEGVRSILEQVLQEADDVPAAVGLGLTASRLLIDLDVAEHRDPSDAVRRARAMVAAGDAADHDAARARLAVEHLDGVLARLSDAQRVDIEAEEWRRLLEAYSTARDPYARRAVLSGVVQAAGAASQMSATMLAVLTHADMLYRQDLDTRTATSRLAIAATISAVLGRPDDSLSPSPDTPRRDPAEAVRLSVEAESRFSALWGRRDALPSMAALLLERALRLSDLGRREEALDTLTALTERVQAAGFDEARRERAQATYWTARFRLQAGDSQGALEAIRAGLQEFGRDADGRVRLWAANGLWSAWRSDRFEAASAAQLREEFATWFAGDTDTAIRRLDATRRLSDAIAAHEAGRTGDAIGLFRAIDEHFGEIDDDDIADTVRLARENARILTATTTTGRPGGAQYREFYDRLSAADALAEEGRIAEAESHWATVIDATAQADDVDLAMLRLAALDAWAGYAQDAGRWEQVAELSRQASVRHRDADTRAERVQARAHFRLGVALTRLGDPYGAVAAYEALEALGSGSRDHDVQVARQQAAYNRAVAIDDLGDSAAAIAAYEHVIAVHQQSVDAPAGRLRIAKALRNQAALLRSLGRTAEAAAAHRRVLDLASGAVEPELMARVRDSAFELAAGFASLGDHPSALATYAWIRATPQLTLSPAESRDLARLEKAARRGRSR
ncbi:hypothetical protein [Microbacterium azadirachtae]|uniref:hypothetical protein n=1 Tax=Microbacterium azadirachtae TaxID=582680 RepID=UPI003F74BA9B